MLLFDDCLSVVLFDAEMVTGSRTFCTSGALYSPRRWWDWCFLMAPGGILAKSFTLTGPRRTILMAPETFRWSRPRRRFRVIASSSTSLVIVSSSLHRAVIERSRASPNKSENHERGIVNPFTIIKVFSMNVCYYVWKILCDRPYFHFIRKCRTSSRVQSRNSRDNLKTPNHLNVEWKSSGNNLKRYKSAYSKLQKQFTNSEYNKETVIPLHY